MKVNAIRTNVLIKNEHSGGHHMMPQRAAIGTAIIVLALVAVIVVAAFGLLVSTNQANPGGPTQSSPQSGPLHTTDAPTNKNLISLRNFGLTTKAFNQTPYLSGEIYVNASVPWASYTFYTNDTICGTQNFNTVNTNTYVMETTRNNTTVTQSVTTTVTNTATQFIYMFKGGPCIPVTVGNTYSITFVVAFIDGTNSTATTNVEAV